MFEVAELGQSVDKETYAAEVRKIRPALLEAQKRLATARASVVLVIGGVEGAGKSETVNVLLEWLDARGIQVHALSEPTDEERERPPMWRFWRHLPPRGRMALFLGSWYSLPIVERTLGLSKQADFQRALQRIETFERMVADDDTLVLKFWLHLSKKAQKARLKALESDPKSSWRVSPLDWKYFKLYDRFVPVCEAALRRTSTAHAPWHIVEAEDRRHRTLSVARTLLVALEQKLGEMEALAKRPKPQPDRPKPAPVNVIRRLDMKSALKDKEYEERLAECQATLSRLSRRLYEKRRSMLLVFEGPDAAGKGGAIRRLTSCLEARQYQVVSVAAPTDEERSHPYLWRFWRNLPRLGRIAIYDRSWYGRVLVERLEGFCAPDEWKRAYSEINAFESELTESGILLMKFWLAITAQEQLRRFKDRETTPYKQYKITEEDWRNRSKWDAYEAAACEMIEKTSVLTAPWILVEANDKNHARIKVLESVIAHMKRALKGGA